MRLSDRELLLRLGAGESIASVCEAAGITRTEFDAWWQSQITSRVPPMEGTLPADVAAPVEIRRDARGIPHLFAENERDLFVAFGFAMGQDRLFQLDWLRRKGSGRLAELLGKPGIEFDLIARTVGLRRIAEDEWKRLPDETKDVLAAFSTGVNAAIAQARSNWPIEFDLLGYEPEPWTPIDSLAIEVEFRWYLTGRFPIIVMPELAKRALGESPLWREYCLGEFDGESILPPGSYAPAVRGSEPVGQSMGGPDSGLGSNNWVVSGRHTSDGKSLLATDPHIAFEAVSCWYPAHLHGGRYHVAGMAYAGMPAIMFGRTERVAWGITNNICSLRDLYEERTDPAHPGCFLYDGQWEPAREIVEEIRVRSTQGADAPNESPLSPRSGGKGSSESFETLTRTIRFSRNGPLVNEILPAPANRAGEPPIALKWLGHFHGGWLTSLLQANRAHSVSEFEAALRPWHVPTFCLVFADVDGNIGMKASGRVPLRKTEERGYRPGWCPDHQWQGLLPFEHMPGVINPDRGWMGTANNRLAPDDFPYALFGRWANGARGLRIRQMIEQVLGTGDTTADREAGFTPDTFRDMHQDALSLRGLACVPGILSALRNANDPKLRAAASLLQQWDGEATPDSVGAALFNVFFTTWARRVADERFDAATAELLMKGGEGAAARLLGGDPAGWFHRSDRETAVVETFAKSVRFLTERFGDDPKEWTWGRLHVMPLKHVLSNRGDLGRLLDHGGAPVRGDMLTVCNTGAGPDWIAATGAGYRHVVELSGTPPELRMIDAQSHSGHPGSPHYSDQFDDWNGGRYHTIVMDRAATADATRTLMTLRP